MTAKFHYINHACFVVAKNDSAIIFDPYLDGNPEGLTADDIKVDYIFISHAHFDHLGSAFEIAKKCDATIITTAEIAQELEKQHGVKVDKRKIELENPIRNIGTCTITVGLYTGVSAKMLVNVEPLK